MVLRYGGRAYNTHWTYTDRDQARLFYQTRAHLMAEPFFRLAPREGHKAAFEFIGARVDHPGTSEQRDFQVVTPQRFIEIDGLAVIDKRLPAARYYAVHRAKWQEIARDGNFIAYDNGIVEDTRTGLEWVAGPDKNTNWNEASSWADGLSLAGGGWRMPSRNELGILYQRGKGTRNMTPLLKTIGWWVWSGEKRDGSSAWHFRFYYGNEDWCNLSDSLNYRGFAVRPRR